MSTPITHAAVLQVLGGIALARLELDEAVYKIDDADLATALSCLRKCLAGVEATESMLADMLE
jgi:hypothetical protein